ncbi:MAG: hypothetical protein IJ467_03220 [Bacteroidaceae bacterium]|nr:hypothetical protein [Bacteroidaceae bacterium]
MSTNASVRSIDELRTFSTYLRNLSANLTNEFEAAKHEMIRVNEGWNDEENLRFMQEFEQTVQVIHRISEHMNEYGVFIQKKCDILDLYRSTHL